MKRWRFVNFVSFETCSPVESSEQIEPLPDIDFNIRTGNSLVGYTSLNDVKRAIEDFGFDFDDQAKEIEKAIQEFG